MTKTRIGSTTDFPQGSPKMIMVGGMPIAVFHIGEKFYAMYDKCSHRGGALHEGYVDGTIVTCPLHGAQFDIATGQNLSPPAPAPVRVFPVHVEGNDVFIEM
jgi:3-phenylpropionate/trans-cinnamate dioxygenase ferredoxin subunit